MGPWLPESLDPAPGGNLIVTLSPTLKEFLDLVAPFNSTLE